jgi:hypothetical protein
MNMNTLLVHFKADPIHSQGPSKQYSSKCTCLPNMCIHITLHGPHGIIAILSFGPACPVGFTFVIDPEGASAVLSVVWRWPNCVSVGFEFVFSCIPCHICVLFYGVGSEGIPVGFAAIYVILACRSRDTRKKGGFLMACMKLQALRKLFSFLLLRGTTEFAHLRVTSTCGVLKLHNTLQRLAVVISYISHAP